MNILQMSISGGLIVALILVFRALALNRVPKSTFLILWGLAALRLLVPFSLPFRMTFLPSAESVRMALSRVISAGGIAGVFSADLQTAWTAQNAESTAERYGIVTPASAGLSRFAAVWLTGILVLAGFFLFVFLAEQRSLRTALPVRGDPVVDGWLSTVRMKRSLRVYCTDRSTCPVSAGVLHPRIVLPSAAHPEPDQLCHILEHEYIHIRRFDPVWKLLLVVCLCVHWVNPLVWAMYLLANRDLELSCDELVIRHFGMQSRRGYARSLLSMAEYRTRPLSLYTGFSRNSLEERIMSLLKLRKQTVAGLVLAAVMIGCTSVVFAAVGGTAAGQFSLTDSISFGRPSASSAAIASSKAVRSFITYPADPGSQTSSYTQSSTH